MQIGFIGLGNMGRGVCHRLIEAGHALTIYDVSSAAMDRFRSLASLASSPEDVFSESEVTFLSLPNSKVVEETVHKFLSVGVSGKTIIDLSTSNPISTRALYTLLKEHDGNLIDAPLSSGPQQAWEGTMQIVVAGDADQVERYRSLFLSFCTHYDYVGSSGNAHLIKLAKNWAGLLQAMLYAQLYPTMEQLGIPAKELYRILDNHVLSNWIFQFYGKKFVEQSYPLDFALSLGYKDICYMRDLCQSVGAPAYMLDGAIHLCEDALAYASAQGLDTVDMSFVCAQVNHAIQSREKS